MQTDHTFEIGAYTVFVCGEAGPLLRSERDAVDLLGATYGSGATWIAIPVGRLSGDFFQLSTGLAGAMLQKLITYGLSVAILGDIAHLAAKSEPLAAFIRESNRGKHVWFVADEDALRAKLGG